MDRLLVTEQLFKNKGEPFLSPCLVFQNASIYRVQEEFCFTMATSICTDVFILDDISSFNVECVHSKSLVHRSDFIVLSLGAAVTM
ncbi:unnamed protein product [Citrullus colocynthis]|uniref:Uncharacterized protein n=1 Tax=Citrullus colocynthis TaxID=252529 RepID=A0ABP0XXW2_9ROSI